MTDKLNRLFAIEAIIIAISPLAAQADGPLRSLFGKQSASALYQQAPIPHSRGIEVYETQSDAPISTHPTNQAVQSPAQGGMQTPVSSNQSPQAIVDPHRQNFRAHHSPQRRDANRRQFVTALQRHAEHLAQSGLTYRFGGTHPAEGGMDCSGTIMHLLSSIGMRNVPRTSYQQYEWLRSQNSVRHINSVPDRAGRSLMPGDLIFWGGTYDSGHPVSHVMIYLGQAPDGRHYMFGARGSKMRGLHGNGVDIFELRAGQHKNLVGIGSLPIAQ